MIFFASLVLLGSCSFYNTNRDRFALIANVDEHIMTTPDLWTDLLDQMDESYKTLSHFGELCGHCERAKFQVDKSVTKVSKPAKLPKAVVTLMVMFGHQSFLRRIDLTYRFTGGKA